MTVTLNVEGMSCNHCVMHVTNALEELDGVTKANVSLEKGVAVVDYDESRVTLNEMKAAVEEAGYDVAG